MKYLLPISIYVLMPLFIMIAFVFAQNDAVTVGGANKPANPVVLCTLNAAGSPIPISPTNPLRVVTSTPTPSATSTSTPTPTPTTSP